MFKMLGVLILSLFLLVSNLSGAMSMHYCHGEPHQLKVEVFNIQKSFVKKLACCCHSQEVDSCCYNQSYDEIFSTSVTTSDKEDNNDFKVQLFMYMSFGFVQIYPKPSKSSLFYDEQANSLSLYKLFSKYILYA